MSEVVLTDDQLHYIAGLADRVDSDANRASAKAGNNRFRLAAEVQSVRAAVLAADAQRIRGGDDDTIVRYAVQDEGRSTRWARRLTASGAKNEFKKRANLAQSVIRTFRP